jgi:phosphate transport system protein
MPVMTRRHFDEELDALQESVLRMGAAVEEMVRDAIAALVTQDLALAQRIIARDDEIDGMDQDIEARCMRLLALQQPMASDLRTIETILKIITDVERIGDHAVDIAQVARRLGTETLYKPLVDIPRLAEMARAMLHDALEAFVHHDLDRVGKVIADDDDVDALYAGMTRDLQARMMQDPTCVLQASYLLFVAHYLERICDHCTNIVERVAFMKTGQMKPLGRGDDEEAPSAPPNLRLSA